MTDSFAFENDDMPVMQSREDSALFYSVALTVELPFFRAWWPECYGSFEIVNPPDSWLRVRWTCEAGEFDHSLHHVEDTDGGQLAAYNSLRGALVDFRKLDMEALRPSGLIPNYDPRLDALCDAIEAGGKDGESDA